jgi:hypothetical protein
MVRQEIYGYLLCRYVLSALICQAATEADIDPGRLKFTRAVRRRPWDPPRQPAGNQAGQPAHSSLINFG